MAEQVHIGATKKKLESIKKSDSQISMEALDIAWKSKKLREDERYLKDMLIWSGNDDVYYEMIKERTRMAKERVEEERKEEERIQKHKEMIGQLIMNILILVATIACIVPIGALFWQFLIGRQ
jgi:ABC-type anion transport system duplicated permease subunit